MRTILTIAFLFCCLPGPATGAQVVVEMHQEDGLAELRYRVGVVDAETKAIDWGRSRSHDDGQAPSVAVDRDLVLEMHESRQGGVLWYKVGSAEVRPRRCAPISTGTGRWVSRTS